MNIRKIFLGAVVLMSLFMADVASAKGKVEANVYMFGMSASFKDSVVYFTDIQKLDSAWIDSKTKFLMSRENYSNQMKSYLHEKLNTSFRTCIVMFSKKKKDIDKKYAKLKEKYMSPKNKARFEVVFIESDEFKFQYIDLTDEESYNNAE